MEEIIQFVNAKSALILIKKGEILLSFIKGKKIFFALKKERVFVQSPSSTYSLSFDEFINLYKECKFIIFDPSLEGEIDSLKDEEYYSWDVLTY